ncbi:tRNA pseudouridine(55) synthase TruB [Priestia taiwanensis]|nr:tRNA pseudouridine(55) synthase TruB [Priestia taiwanensis]
MEGIVLLHKPKGLTSHDCVFKLRKLLREKKIGHTGTLDPDVTGVLPICVGRATKLVEYLTSDTKTYEGEVTLGFSTTTEDASGEVVEQKSVERVIKREEVLQVLQSLTGQLQQTPPMYSAVKVNGKKLYEYARKGIEVERPIRTITIDTFELLDDRETFEGEEISFRFRVACSKGTYVRTLAVMIGERLGYPSHMSDLIRTASGKFTLEQCYTFEQLEQFVEEGNVQEVFISIDEALSMFPRFEVDGELEQKIRNGGIIKVPTELLSSERIAIYNNEGRCLAIYQTYDKNPSLFKPEKVLVNNNELK